MATLTPNERLVGMYHKAVTEQGGVLDVSKVTVEGKGTRSEKKYPTSASKKHYITGVPVISDSTAAFRLAMQILGPEWLSFADEFDAAHGAGASVSSDPRFNRLYEMFMKAYNSNGAQMLDVSAVNNEGKGTALAATPKGGARNTKMWVPPLPIMSNNYAAYAFVTEVLDPVGYGKFAEDFLASYGDLQAPASTPRTPQRTPVKELALGAGYALPKTLEEVPADLQPASQEAYTNLWRMYAAAEKAGKALDVSNLTQMGTGSVLSPYPKGAGLKKSIEGADVVISNNWHAYALAMVMLGPDWYGYANIFLDRYGLKVGNTPRAAIALPPPRTAVVPIPLPGPARPASPRVARPASPRQASPRAASPRQVSPRSIPLPLSRAGSPLSPRAFSPRGTPIANY